MAVPDTQGGAHRVPRAELQPGADLGNVRNVQDLRPVLQHVRPQLGRGREELHPGALLRVGLAAERLANPLAHLEVAVRAAEELAGRHGHRAHVVV